MTPVIRELFAPEEVRALEPLVLEYFLVVTGELSKLGAEVDPAGPVRNMMENLERFVPPLGRAYVAEMEGELVGMAFLKPLQDAKMELKRLYVRPSTQGTGLGRRLLLHTEMAARDLGVTEIFLDTIKPLEAAIGLYKAEGYSFIDAYEESEAASYEVVRPHAVFMSKQL